MSDRVGLKTKDNASKKFSSLNLNQTYKGTKVETKASTGVPRHGLQSLGKVASSRRMPPPANLPSLKSENLGNDPTVALVPSGGGGWGSGKEKEATAAIANKNQGQPTAVSQQPVKPTESSQKASTGQQTSTTTSTNQTSARTWASGSSSVAGGQERTSYRQQSQYFNQEFPTLSGGNSKDRSQAERASQPQYGQPQRNMHEPPWMDKGGSGPPPPASSFGMYNGAPYPGPPQRGGYRPQMYHRDGHSIQNHSRPEGAEDFPYMGQSRPTNYATHPAANQRGHPGSRIGSSASQKHMIKLEESPSGYVRPSILKESDIRAMDAEDADDGGWAGAQEEIDYSVKLNFDDDEPPSPVGHDKPDGQNKPSGSVRDEPPQGERAVNGEMSRRQAGSEQPPLEPRRAWAIPDDNQNNFKPQWGDARSQGPYHLQGQYNAQRTWQGHAQQRMGPPNQQRMGPPPPLAGHLSAASGKQTSLVQSQSGNNDAEKPVKSERSIQIEQARQRKLFEEEERKQHQAAAAREKLRQLDAKTHQIHVHIHDGYAREQAGPRSPVSPAGSDAPVRRIMRRKDSGSIGDDDGSSVKSVESVGKEEEIPENRKQINKPRDLRKTLSDEIQEERKSPALKKSDDERKANHETVTQEKDKDDWKPSLVKDIRENDVDKQKMERHDENEETTRSVEGRAAKKHIEDQEKRPERKNSESRPRSDEAFRKSKSQLEREEEHENNKSDFESRKENNEKRGSRLSSKNERGSSESVRSRDSVEKRKDDRRRPEDIKRKREDFERSERSNGRGNRDRLPSKDRFYSSRGRPPLGAKSSLRGHPKSYSHGRNDRTTTPNRNRSRNDSAGDDEMKDVAPEEKSQVAGKSEERRWSSSDRQRPENDRRRPNGGRRQQPYNDKQLYLGSDRQELNVGKHQRGGDRHEPEGGRRETSTDKQQINDQRRKDYSDSRFYDSGKRNERGLRDDRTRDERQNKSSGRLTSRGGAPTNRSEIFGGKTKHRGGFGKPPAKEQPGQNEGNEKSEVNARGKAKSISSSINSKEPQEGQTTESGKSAHVAPVTNAWGVAESKSLTKELKIGDAQNLVENTVSENNVDKSPVTVPLDSTSDIKGLEKADVEKQYDLVTERTKHKDGKENKDSTNVQTKRNDQDSKTRERNDRRFPYQDYREQNKDYRENKTSRDFSRGESSDSKFEKRRDSGTYEENLCKQDSKFDDRRKQDSKFDDRRTYLHGDDRHNKTGGEQPRKTNERKAPRLSGNKNDHDQDSKQTERQERKDVRYSEKKSVEKGRQKEFRNARQSERGQDRREGDASDKVQDRRDRTDRGDNSLYRERRVRRDQRDQDKSDQNNKNERNRNERREQTDRRNQREGHEQTDRRSRTGQREGTDRRDRNIQRNRVNHPDQSERVENKMPGDYLEKENNAEGEQKKEHEQIESLLEKDAGKDNESTEKQVVDRKQSDRFNVGTISPAMDRRRYNDSRRGTSSSRRGSRGATRGMRGRGRGRSDNIVKHVGIGSTASNDDADNDSDDFHSANSSVDDGSDGSDVEEVFQKQGDRPKDDKRPPQSYSSGSRTKPLYNARGRGRGSSPLSRSPRKPAERAPRFQRQEQARNASRGRGKSNRGGFSSKENWDENMSKSKDDRTLDEGPLPKKRPPDSSYSNERGSDSYRGRKTTRGSHSGSKSSFLAKKQQEIVEGSSRKGNARFGAKSTIPAALTTHGRNERRTKNEPLPVDGDENLEPPKKNPRRTEPVKLGIGHIDMSNIASFIDVDDIVHPASDFEPSSPQSGFVEVKSKRTQKELREKAREEEDRKRRETDKMMQEAQMKPKGHKANSQNKQHQLSKPTRFVSVASALPGGNTPPRAATPVPTSENSLIIPLSSGSLERKQTSPLMMEKPSSPPPPPMFNAWTKPLSLTPAKPPNEASVELTRTLQPDPLAVGSGKPQRASGSHPKSEEPELHIQLTLPDTFQAIPGERDIDSQSADSRIFSRVDGAEIIEQPLKKSNDESIREQPDSGKPDGVRTRSSNVQKTDSKDIAQCVKTIESSIDNDRSTRVDSEKRQPSGSNWKSVRGPRFEKSATAKRNSDGRKLKADSKDVSGESKSQAVHSDADKASKEKNDNRPRSASRAQDASKTMKTRPQVKAPKSQNGNENGDQNIERNSQDNPVNGEQQQNLNKRDSVELDVQSISDSLLDDETPLGVHMGETSKAGNGTSSMVKIKTEDDIKMQEKMVAAKKAWDHSVSSSASMPQWKASVSEDEDTESTEASVVSQIPITSPEPEESSEPLGTVATPRLKKPAPGEQQNVCKVKPQQQQPVKPQPVPTEIHEEYPNANTTQRPALESQAQVSYPVQPHTTAIFTSKPPTQGYTYSFEQQALVPINHQYVQTDLAAIQQHHVSPVRPQTLHAASQSSPQRAGNYSPAQPVSTPSPLSHQPLLQDTYRPLMQAAALYSTNTYASNQYFPISVVRPAAPPHYQTTVNEDISNSVYTLQAPKPRNTNHGYESAPSAGQQVFLPVEQPTYPTYVSSQRQHPVGFYSDTTNQTNLGGMPTTHMQKPVVLSQVDKQVQSQHSRDNRIPSGQPEQQQAYPPPGQSEMSKHVHAKPFQPPSSSPPGNASHPVSQSVRQMPTAPGQNNVSPAYPNAVLMQSASSLQSSISSSGHTGTSPIVTQAHALPVSRLSFQHFPTPAGSYQRQMQVPVQQLQTPTYPAGLAYRSPVPNYSTTTSVGNQSSVLVHKSAPMMRQVMTAPVPHRMPEPIQRPSKAVFNPNNLKEKQINPQPRLKTVHQLPRRAFNSVSTAQAQMATYQFQPLAGPQQPSPPQQQQQMFRNQQHQQMLSNVQQFFAEEKEIEHQRKQKQANPKREQSIITTLNSDTTTNQQAIEEKQRKQQQPKIQHEFKQENKPQKSKDEQKKRAQRQENRRGVRTAQIPPRQNQTRPQNRPKPTTAKQEPVKSIQQMSGVVPSKAEAKKMENIPSSVDVKAAEDPSEVVSASLVT